MKDLVDAIAKGTGLVSFAVLVLAFVYEYAFYFVLGRELQSLMAATDYFATAVRWLPATGFFVVLGGVAALLEMRIDNFRSEDVIKAGFKSPFRAWIARDAPIRLTWWAMVSIGFFQLLFDNPYSTLFEMVFLAAIWLWLVRWFFKHELFQKRLNVWQVAMFTFGPMLLILAFMQGIDEGYKALTKIGNVYVVRMKEGGEEKNLQLLRILSEGILARDPIMNRTVYMKWNEVVTVASRAGAPDSTPLFCRFTGFFCSVPIYPG